MEPAVKLDDTIESQALAIPNKARSILVIDNDSMEQANQFNLDIRDAIKQVNDFFAPLVSKAHETHKALTTRRAETLKPLEEASALVTGQVKTYLKKIREEEERQAAILREQARKEEEDRRLTQAAELEQNGNVDEANELLDEPIVYVAPVPRVEIPKVDNRLYRTTLKVKVTNRPAFLANAPMATLLECLNEAAWAGIESGLSRKAKALGEAFNMPGVTLTEQ